MATPSSITIVFCSSSKCGWVGMSKSRVIANKAFEHPADADVLDRKAADRLADRAQGGGEFGDVMMRRHILRLEMDLGDAVVIAGDQAVEDLGQPQPRLAVDPAHDPEIDRRDPAVGEGEQIALVKVGVEIAVDHRLAKEGADQDRRQRLGVMAGGDQLRRAC